MTTEPVDYDAIPGCRNGYVLQGKTKADRLARLEQVPAEFRERVESHVRTVFAIRQRAAARRHTNTNRTGGAS